MFKTCAQTVEGMFKGWARSSTFIGPNITSPQSPMEKSRLISNLSQTHSHRYTQVKSFISPLFEQVFYPVSTTPIITKMR